MDGWMGELAAYLGWITESRTMLYFMYGYGTNGVL